MARLSLMTPVYSFCLKIQIGHLRPHRVQKTRGEVSRRQCSKLLQRPLDLGMLKQGPQYGEEEGLESPVQRVLNDL
jgi:hypothetical protein